MSWAHLGWKKIQGLQELREMGTCTNRIVLLSGQLGRETTSSPYFGPIILRVGTLKFSIGCLVIVLLKIACGTQELLSDEKNKSSSYLMMMKDISSST